MPDFVVNYSPVGGTSTTVVGSAGGDDVLILNWGAATVSQGLSMVVPDVAGDASGGGQIGVHNYVTYSFMERFQVTTGTGQDDFTLGNGNDIASMGDGNDSVNTRAGEAQVDGGNGTDRWAVNWTGLSGAIVVNLQTNTLTGVGGSTVNGIEQLGYGLANQFRTGSGNDVLTSLIGPTATYDDYMHTGAGNDTVVAGGGADTIDLGAGGDDLLIVDFSWIANGIASSRTGSGLDWNGIFQPGSAGPNVVIYSNVARFDIRGATGADVILTGSNNDTVTSGTGNDNIDTEAGEVVLNGGADVDSWAANYTALSTGVTVNLQNSTISGVGGSTIAGLEVLGYGLSNQFRTGSGNDVLTTLTGTSATYGDYIQTNAGNDSVLVGGGGDTVDLGAGGDDVLIVDYSAFANGIVTGGSFAGSGADWGGLYQVGGSGPDLVFFSNVARFDIRGATGGDTILTGSNNDTVTSGTGNDRIDTEAGEVVLNGGADVDSWAANYTGLSIGVTVNLQNSTIAGVGGSAIAGIEGLGYGGSNQFRTGSGNDVLTTLAGTSATYGDYIQTNTGNDTVLVGGGGDTVDLGAGGDDVLIVDYSAFANGIVTGGSFAGSGADWGGLYQVGGSGPDFVFFSNVARFDIRGATGGDTILTGSNNDTIVSGNGNDTVSAGAGDDFLNGGTGNDSLTGGTGSDVYVVDSVNDVITEAAGDAADEVRTTLTSFTLGTTAGSSNVENLTFTGTAGFAGTGTAAANAITGGTGNDFLTGAGGDDNLNGGTAGFDYANYLDASTTAGITLSLAIATAQNTGGSGTDTLTSIEGIYGSNLGDTLTGDGAAVNALYGWGGADLLTGAGGFDYVEAGEGDDTLDGGAGDDYLLGGNGTDWVTYYGSTAAVYVDMSGASAFANGTATGFDVLSGIERVYGSIYGDFLFGSAGSDTLAGDLGIDILYGFGLGDSLDGGGDTDYLVGGAGADTITTGAGQDYIYFQGQTEGKDTITDWRVSGFDILCIDEPTFGGGLTINQYLSDAGNTNRFVVGTAATAAIGQFLWNSATSTLSWDADGTGGGAAVQLVTLTGITTLTAGDILVL